MICNDDLRAGQCCIRQRLQMWNIGLWTEGDITEFCTLRIFAVFCIFCNRAEFNCCVFIFCNKYCRRGTWTPRSVPFQNTLLCILKLKESFFMQLLRNLLHKLWNKCSGIFNIHTQHAELSTPKYHPKTSCIENRSKCCTWIKTVTFETL